MNKNFLLTLMLVLSFQVLADSPFDLKLEGERWEATAQGYICSPYGDLVSTPSRLGEFNVKFERIRTDYSLDNGLLIASFVESDVTCRYSALMWSDNAGETIELVESKAHANGDESLCQKGKLEIDSLLNHVNNYWYWGHPHHLTIVTPSSDAKVLCGDEKTHVGIDFLVTKFLGKK